MNRKPSIDEVVQCLDGFTAVDERPIPEGYPVTVFCGEQDGQPRFLYNVQGGALGPKAKDAEKWILHAKLESLLQEPYRRRTSAVSLGQAIEDLDFATLGPGYRRGIVMACWKAKVCTVTGGKAWHDDFDRAWLTGENAEPKSEAYTNPEFVIRMKPGSIWIPELHQRRYQILTLINKRFDNELLRSVRIK